MICGLILYWATSNIIQKPYGRLIGLLESNSGTMSKALVWRLLHGKTFYRTSDHIINGMLNALQVKANQNIFAVHKILNVVTEAARNTYLCHCIVE